MSELKKKRVLSAILSGAIMLLCILVTIVVYQLAGLISKRNTINRLDREIAELQTEIEQTENEIASWELEWKIEQAARELGMHKENEN